MTTDAVYLVDANVLIEAKNRYYSFSVCPGFWNALVWHAGAGSMCGADVVKRELRGGNDDLADWVRSLAPADVFFSTNDADVVAVVRARHELGAERAPVLAGGEGRVRTVGGSVARRLRLCSRDDAGHARDSRAHVPQEGQDPGCLSPVRCDLGEHIRDT